MLGKNDCSEWKERKESNDLSANKILGWCAGFVGALSVGY